MILLIFLVGMSEDTFIGIVMSTPGIIGLYFSVQRVGMRSRCCSPDDECIPFEFDICILLRAIQRKQSIWIGGFLKKNIYKKIKK